MPIVTKYKYLRAAVNHTTKNDVRWYLTGVYLGDGYIASTNGHHAIIINDPEIYGLGLIIPSDAIKSLIRKVGTKFIGNVSIEVKDGGFGLMSCNGYYEYFKFINEKFPDIKKVDVPEPQEPLATWVYINPDYLKLFQKSMHELNGSKIGAPLLKPTGENSVIYVELTDYAHGLLMPLRV